MITFSVLVFPTLSPNYLRVVRYHAKLCDLAFISLGSGSAKSIGVCHKKYFLSTIAEDDRKPPNPCNTLMAENSASAIRKKRPPIQLYIPPAQRKSRLSISEISVQKEATKAEVNLRNSRTNADTSKFPPNSTEQRDYRISASRKDSKSQVNARLEEEDTDQAEEICYCPDDIDYFLHNKISSFPFFSYQCCCVKFFLFKDIFPYAKLLIFSIKRMKHSFHWIRCDGENNSILVEDRKLESWAALQKAKMFFIANLSSLRPCLFVPTLLDFRNCQNLQGEYFQRSSCLCGDRILLHLPDHMHFCYLTAPALTCWDDGLTPDYNLNCEQDGENRSLSVEDNINATIFPQISKTEEIDLDNVIVNTNRTESPLKVLQNELSNNCDSKTYDVCAKSVFTFEADETSKRKSVITNVVVLTERVESAKSGSKPPQLVNDKTKQNEHEQEKEIMRKAKQNINRKTRPIIKYVDDDNDTLKIGRGDNINNWEDLFNDEGELQEDIFSEIVQKVGPQVTILKATEDYSAYSSKQIEELEHMVELYDFPDTLETRDIISAFSGLNSDSMYVKWVDDTHALLVLGSSTQAQKAIELSNPLIKARPMSAASSLALEKANQCDLKPAMKRPQTNLQTARRLITSHLGAKSKVSKEQTAKEREDLRVAKELKKQLKQNEKDAWEGNLRSALN